MENQTPVDTVETSRTLIWQGDFVKIETEPSQYGIYEIVTAKTKAGADLIVTHGNKVLLVNQYRPPVQKHLWSFPGGSIDEGENPAIAAARELEEETGVQVPLNQLTLLGSTHQLPGTADSEGFYFHHKLDENKPLPAIKPQAGEIQEVAWFDIDDILDNHNRQDMFKISLYLLMVKHLNLL